MSFRDRLAQLISRKVSSVYTLFQRVGPGQPKATPKNYESYSKEAYQKCAIAFAAIRMVARGAAHVPWCLYSGYGKRLKEIDDENNEIMRLISRPNPRQPGAAFWEGHVSFWLMHGNAYLNGVSLDTANDKGLRPPKELYSYRPDRMRAIAHPVIADAPGRYQYEYAGGKVFFDMDPVTGTGPINHWKTFNPTDDWYGQSALDAAAMGVDTHNEANNFNLAMLQNGGTPSGAMIYSPEGQPNAKLTVEQRKQLEKSLEEKFEGSKNAGRPMILDGGLKWQEMGLSQKTMAWLDGKQSSARDICAALGVPSQLLGDTESQTFANYEEARAALWEDTIIPVLDSLKDQLNSWLIPAFDQSGEVHLEPDLDDVPALAVRRKTTWDMAGAATWLSTNEKRALTKYEPLDDPVGDEILVSATQTPLTQTGATGEEGETDPNAPSAPTDGASNQAPADQVQQAALSGQQIDSLLTILDDVTRGQLAPEAAVAVIMLAFPTFAQEAVQSMVDEADSFEPEDPPADLNALPPAQQLPGKPQPGQPTKPPAKPGAFPPKAKKVRAMVRELLGQGFDQKSAAELADLAYGEKEAR